VQQILQLLAISLVIFISREWQILHLEPFALEARDDAGVEIMRVGSYIETSWWFVPFIFAPVGVGAGAGEIRGFGRLKRGAGAAATTPEREMLAQSIHLFLATLIIAFRPCN
jgi:hypothetical protein